MANHKKRGTQASDEVASDLPAELSTAARRALFRAGHTQLDQLTTVKESELNRMHGMGSKPIGQLRVALAARGQGLAAEDSP